MNKTIYQSPVGKLLLSESGGKLRGLFFYHGEDTKTTENRLLLETEMQLTEYFSRTRRKFDIPIELDVSEFEAAVFGEIKKIPYGTTTTYSHIATALGNPNASRAVGTACHNNPIAIIIPCHRVIGVGANLVGFADGIDIKEKLLRFEGAIF